MMNQQIDVIKQILELMNTMAEGIAFVKGKLDQQSPEEAVNVLLDTTNAFATIELALQPILSKLPENSIQEKIDRLRSALATMVSEYEQNQGRKGQEILQFNLEPAFKNWQTELEQVLKPYILN
ncbi:MAG: hypothetical protein KGZ96_06065 [Clostridia bacterium]|nr:hypothetical protein [Clostridia bacterium]